MSLGKFVSVASVIWISAITVLHGWLNLAWFEPKKTTAQENQFRVGFIPVTCHLTCPVTHFINDSMKGDGEFIPARFQGFPELKEAFLARYMDATFILAPLAMKLREERVPIKIVYLGHRDGTAVMVRKNSDIYRIEDLRGKKVAVPSRFSNQRIMLFRALKNRGMTFDDITLLEMPPPDMPVALSSGAVDAISSGEPFMGQAEMDGYGRVLFRAKDEWPGFISCVLAVHEDAIKYRRADVQRLVDGIAKSGRWLDQSIDHRVQASQFVSSPTYYNQNPKLLEFVLTKPPDHVKYSNLNLVRKDFEEIERLAVESGVHKGTVHFEDYADPSFVPDEKQVQPHQWEYKP